MRHLLKVIVNRSGDQLTFTHAAACGAAAKCLCTDVRNVDCPECKEIANEKFSDMPSPRS